MTISERLATTGVWLIASLAVIFLLTPLVVTVVGIVRLERHLHAAPSGVVVPLV